MQQLFAVFVESIWEASIIPFAQETTLAALHAFKSPDYTVAIIIAFFAALIGQTANWLLGALLAKSYDSGAFKLKPAYYAKAQSIFKRYGLFLLVLSFIPFVNIIVVIAGFLRLPYTRICLPLIALGYAFYYGQMLLSA